MSNENICEKSPNSYWNEFKFQWEHSWFHKQMEIKDDIQKYVWTQMNIFFSGALLIHQITCIDGNGNIIKYEKLHTELIFRQISIPILRLLLESYFRVIYICSCKDIKIQSERFKKILSTTANEYNKFIKVLNEYPKYFNKLIDGLPPCAKSSGKSITIKNLLKDISSSEENNLSFLYGFYRLTSFYVHGNIDIVTWKVIFGKDAISYTLPLDIFGVISIISKFYIYIACLLWCPMSK